MTLTSINAKDAPDAFGGYAQAVKVSGSSTLLFVSGQIPLTAQNLPLRTFADQCRQAWQNVEAQLRAADMSFDNLVKVTTFLSSRADADENGAIRREFLGARTPALTVVIAGIFDEAWLVEIEAIAAS